MTSAALRIGITGYAHAGGSGVIAGELGRQLARRGHTVHFIADAPPFRFSSFAGTVAFHEVATTCDPPVKYPPYTLALATKMAQVSRQFDLDILHVHYAVPHTAAAILAQSILGNPTRPKLVTTLHGTDVTLIGSQPSLHEATAYCVRASGAVTAVSPFLKRKAVEAFSDSVRIEVIPNFVDLRTFSRAGDAAERTKLAASEDLLLVHLSSFRPVKRPLDTLRILAAVNARRPARLLLIGDGPEIPAVRREADRLQVSDRVELLGNRVDVQPLLACSDVFLLPSQEESFGLALLEAIACGVPAVTSDVGGLEQLVENGRNGYRVAVGDIESMAARVLDMVADSATLERHRSCARQTAERFDADLIVPMYEALYRRILA